MVYQSAENLRKVSHQYQLRVAILIFNVPALGFMIVIWMSWTWILVILTATFERAKPLNSENSMVLCRLISLKIKLGFDELLQKQLYTLQSWWTCLQIFNWTMLQTWDTVWRHCHQPLPDKLESLQSRATDMKMPITHWYYFSWGQLSIRKLIIFNLAIGIYKVAKGIAPLPTQEMFEYLTDTYP